jgi:pyruvate dehydrogenase E2 component (dihydrolipoamide acetyltransferase)
VGLEFALPDVGEGIDAAELLEWHVAVGDEVREDQPLADVQTDKATVVIPCPTSGRVVELRAEVGERVGVGAVLAVFEPAGERAAGGDGRAAPAAAGTTGTAEAAAGADPAAAGRRPLASPAVRRLARERGIDLAAVAGSGPEGRIVREDLERAGAAGAPPAPAAADDEVVPLRGVRRAIAHAMTRAWREIPHIIDYREVDAGELLGARRTLRARAAADGDERLAGALTLTPLVVKIAVHALRRHPYVNASVDLEREQITLHRRYDIGIATAAPAGLVVPVVHGADGMSLAELALAVHDLAAAARDNRLAPRQLAGGTFTVNNYGTLGGWLGTPIIRPPEVANLGVGRVQERPVAIEGEVIVRPLLALAISGDHRVLDGHTLAAFAADVVALMEDPLALLVDAR